jgi:hypothetical protein
MQTRPPGVSRSCSTTGTTTMASVPGAPASGDPRLSGCLASRSYVVALPKHPDATAPHSAGEPETCGSHVDHLCAHGMIGGSSTAIDVTVASRARAP